MKIAHFDNAKLKRIALAVRESKRLEKHPEKCVCHTCVLGEAVKWRLEVKRLAGVAAKSRRQSRVIGIARRIVSLSRLDWHKKCRCLCCQMKRALDLLDGRK